MSLRYFPQVPGTCPTAVAILLVVFAIGLPGCTNGTKTADPNAEAKPAEPDGSTDDAMEKPMAAFHAIENEYESKLKEVREASRAAKTDEERNAAWANSPNREEYAKRFAKVVEEHPNTEAARKSLVWMSRSREFSSEIIAAMRREMVDSEDTVQLLSRLTRNPDDELESVFDNVIENSTVKLNRAFATYYKAKRLMYRNKIETHEEDIRSLLASIATEYPEIPDSRGGTLKDAADAVLFELDHLQVGKEAPEIEGEDIHGEEFKLSDYRGKVVFLDFWGDW